MARPFTPFRLPAADQSALEQFTRTGRRTARAVRRAQALLALATGIGQQAAGKAAGLSRQTVSQLRSRYEQAGWQAALTEAPRRGTPARFDGPQRAAVTALACTPAPTGHSRWTLRLLADKAVELQLVDSISHETVSQVLKKTNCSPTASSTGVWGR
ncbi:helix-turn-helix domain-containing protein (plasmid) [Hymenobacter sp. NBH84]|uniref:helix-turn-helix domain-containing protein n=1 Tax=Hymenobacter sp. NBH84 TaxID=2596915 RepID=UPI001627F00A|nr:helix-turn-helix domain-containing protein [Hymenobacter sp. NBH84]QNE42215.1 helix-turn-helix domain-containing protein [Hymenobacter sp. NBH84]